MYRNYPFKHAISLQFHAVTINDDHRSCIANHVWLSFHGVTITKHYVLMYHYISCYRPSSSWRHRQQGKGQGTNSRCRAAPSPVKDEVGAVHHGHLLPAGVCEPLDVVLVVAARPAARHRDVRAQVAGYQGLQGHVVDVGGDVWREGGRREWLGWGRRLGGREGEELVPRRPVAVWPPPEVKRATRVSSLSLGRRWLSW